MAIRNQRGLCELYAEDPERADWLVFGRRAGPGRRGFLKGAGLATMAAAVGASIPFHRNMPSGLIPAALAEGLDVELEGKDGLTVLGDRPVNAETPPHLLDAQITPNERHFVRNNGLLPQIAESGDASGWTLTVDGEVEQPLTLSLDDLRNRFEVVTYQLQLECGGNGRAGFNPPASGNQWTVGAVGNAAWTGVRVRDVFNAAGIKDSAVYTGYFPLDAHLSGDPEKLPISRGAPMWKMMDPYTLIAWEMNGEPLPKWHGFPARVVAPGWPGSVSGKWIERIWVRNQVHDGPKMTGMSYRVPRYPVAPGTEVPEEDFVIIESMPVKSVITYPQADATIPSFSQEIRGSAWAGDKKVKRLDVSYDFGATWHRAELDEPVNPYAWQRWRIVLTFPQAGYYEVWARATDEDGTRQPFAIAWNPRGYLNNSMHRIALTVDV